MVAPEVAVELGVLRLRQTKAGAGDAGVARRVGTVEERAIPEGGLPELPKRDVLVADENRVALAVCQIVQRRARLPLQDAPGLAGWQHLTENDRAVRIRAIPRVRLRAVPRGAGVVAQGAGEHVAVGACIPGDAVLRRAPAGGAVIDRHLCL